MLSIRQFVRSFKYAFKGLYIVFKEEQSFRIQFFAAILVLALAFLLKIELWKIIALIFISIFILVLEVVNSILERIVDALRPRINVFVEVIKDMMAAAVLLASLSSVIIGILIFWPYIKNLIS